MEATIILDDAWLCQNQACGLIRLNHDIKAAAHGRRVRDNVLIDPRNCITDLCFNFFWREDELVDNHVNHFRLRRDRIYSPCNDHKYDEIPPRQHVMLLISVQRRLARRAADAPGRF